MGKAKSQNQATDGNHLDRCNALTTPAQPTARPLLALTLLIVLAYLPVLHNGFINLDDPDYVVENYHVQSALTWQSLQWSFHATLNANWHPLTWLSHMLDFQIFGLQPWGHHLTSLVIHTANTCLVFLVLRRMTGTPWPSWLVAAWFGLHPMHVESVAWVSERKDVLCALFWLLALWAYVRHVQTRASLEKPFPGFLTSKFYPLSLLFFATALLSKPMVVTLPFVLLLLDYWPLNRFSEGRLGQVLYEKLPFALLAAALCVVTIAVQHHGGALMPIADLPWADRCQNALVSYASYGGKLLFPANLAVFYPYPTHWPIATVLGSGFLMVALTVFAVVFRRQHPWLLVGWLWFVGTLFPVIGLVQVGSQAMADRYSYLPSIGFFVAIAWGISALAAKWHQRTAMLTILGAATMVLCSGLTWRQLGFWKDSGTLFRHTLAVTKDNLLAYSNLGDYEVKQGNVAEGIRLYRTALEIQPDFAPINEQLGVALCQTGNRDEGLVRIQASLLTGPGSALTHSDLGNVFVAEGKVEDAINEYRKAIKLYPDYFSVYNRLGDVFEKAGRFDDAIALYKQAVEQFPAYADAHESLGLAWAYNRRVDDAITEYEKALKLNQASAKAHFGLAVLLEGKGQVDDAISQFQAGLRTEPNSPQVYNEMGVMLAKQGRLDEAIGQFQATLKLDPDNARAKANLALALQSQKVPAQKPAGTTPK